MKTKTSITCLFIAFTAILSSCKKNELSNSKNKELLTLDENRLAYAGDNLYDVLGYGYDVTGRLANSESCRLPVLDVVKFVKEDPGSYTPNDHVIQYFGYSFGENAEGYVKELDQKYTATTGLLGVFKGEMNASFNSKDTFSSKYAYASASLYIKQKSMRIYSTVNNLRDNYLTDKFKSDVASLSPQELVYRYGTHVLIDITLGAKFDMNYQTQTTSSDKYESAKAGLVLNGMFKTFGMTGDISTKKEESESNYDQTLDYSSVGGDGTKGPIGVLSLDNSTLKLSIADWQSTCKATNAALIKIGTDGFVALEDLISDATKSAAVKAYIKSYLEANKINMVAEPNDSKTPIWYPNGDKIIFTRGQEIFTENKKYKLTLQNDGNFVLYNLHTGEVLWATNKYGGDKVIFQSDGNLVIYTNDDRVIWASNIYWRNMDLTGSKSIFFALQEDGNFVLYNNGKAVAATNTSTSRSRNFGVLK